MNHNYFIEIYDIAGKIFDIFNSCRWLYFKDELLNQYENSPVPIDDDIKSSLNYIYRNVEISQYKMDLLFYTDEFVEQDFITSYFLNYLWNFSTIEDFLNHVKNLDKLQFIKAIIHFFDDSLIKQDLTDYSVPIITECLEKSLIKDDIKYKILVICAEPDILISSIHQLFCNVAEKINVIYNKFNKRMIEFRLSIEKPIISLSDEIFQILTSKYLNLEKDDKIIKIAISFLNDYTILPVFKKETCLYAVLGIGYKKALKVQLEKEKLTNIDFLAVTKALSDKIRIEIIDMLIDGGKYTSEIADNLNLPFPKAFYHLSILAKSNILTLYNQGKRVYYEINSDFFLYFSQYIKRRYVNTHENSINFEQKNSN
ncbi:MAG: winged helix-turn-helix domain-containing protein [Oscillospiraceae bacterium]